MKVSQLVCYLLVAGWMLSACGSSHATVKQKRLSDYVDPFIGTDGPGNTYPGATVPFGMVQLSPDNGLPGWDRIAGYFWQDSTIAGFSHRHLTGTGAGDLYDVLIFPYNSRFSSDLWPDQADVRPYSKFSHEKEQAAAGYYAVQLLSSGIYAELTTTERVGMHRYTFPKDAESKVLIDLGYKLNWDNPTQSSITIVNDTTITGYRYSTGWAPDQREHFVIKLSKPIKDYICYNDTTPVQGAEVTAVKTKVELTFEMEENEQLLLQVALSSNSIEGAQKNLLAECNHWNFDAVVEQAKAKWDNLLGRVQVEGSDEQKTIFYTNLYHCFLTPSMHADVDGWYKGADGKVHQAVGYEKLETFSLWDTYRTAHPLYTILVPDKVESMVQSFLSHFDETGLLPVWSFAGNETNMMIGYHAVPVIVDAYLKGVPMDAEKAYQACVATAMSNAWSLADYKKYGYVPYDDANDGHWSVSKTLEYAYDDWCIARFASALNKKEDAALFYKRAGNWKNLYDPSSTFFRPKNKQGEFINHFIPKEYTELFCESNAWQYFWHVQHDIPGLINLVGETAFVAKLDSMFSYYPGPDDELPIFSTGMIGQYAHGNEPSHHVAYLYNYVGQPHKTQAMVRQLLTSQYTAQPDGYCGNEDCGQMSAWYIMSSLGLYPVNPADGVYHLTSPLFRNAQIALPNGNIFAITTANFDSSKTKLKEIWLNGTPVTTYTITHKEVMQGGELLFVFE